jgi:large subunit ribosomal protein L9
MKVLLRSDVKGVGRRGDIVEVKSGFARNFLLPTGAGLKATDDMASQATSMRRSRDLREANDRSAAMTQKSAIEARTVTITARASANGRLFGSITENDVASAIVSQLGVGIDRANVHLTEHLKVVGPATATAHLFEGVDATVTIEVVAKA